MPHSVSVNLPNVNLPNGFYYQPGSVVVLSDVEFAQLASDLFTKNVNYGGNPNVHPLTDLGVTGPGGDAVTTQGAAVTLTSAQNAVANATDLPSALTLVNALKVSFNALQVDVAALNTALSGAGKPLV